MEANINKSLEIKRPENIAFLHAKSQKLATALYLITGFFSDNEPLKWKLRELSTKLIANTLVIKDSSEQNKESAEARALILEIKSLLAVLKQAGHISEMNYSILDQEFSLILTSLADSNELINKDLFDVPEQIYREAREIPRTVISAPKTFSTPLVIKDKNPEMLKEYSVVAVKKNSRQSIIINLLKRKKEIMIKDVSPLIEGCSEKTIQRELLSMVKDGILDKMGEKRWSRYSLAK